MVDTTKIQAFCDNVAKRFKPLKVILFGSYAAGKPGPDSDVDILVVLPFEGKPVKKALEILNTIDPRFPIDLIVRTPEQVADRIRKSDFFMRDIMKKGKVLYEAPDQGVGEKGGRRLRQRIA